MTEYCLVILPNFYKLSETGEEKISRYLYKIKLIDDVDSLDSEDEDNLVTEDEDAIYNKPTILFHKSFELLQFIKSMNKQYLDDIYFIKIFTDRKSVV